MTYFVAKNDAMWLAKEFASLLRIWQTPYNMTYLVAIIDAMWLHKEFAFFTKIMANPI